MITLEIKTVNHQKERDMHFDIHYKDQQVIIKNVKDFEPQHIFECGQCFRWNKEADDSFTGVVLHRVLNVKKINEDVVFTNTTIEDFNSLWMKYFDLDTDYGRIKDKISRQDKIMQQAVSFGEGIRILKQDPWETLISFIISANNNIPRIKTTIETLSRNYGEYLGEFYGKERYAFPSPEVLAELSVEKLKDCGTGYRASYIKDTAARISNNPTELKELMKLDIDLCQKKLLKYQGVGPKVAHCVLFFVWVKWRHFQ